MQAIFLFIHLLILNAPPQLNKIDLLDLNGKKTNIQFSAAQKGTVIYFLSPECPLCQSYSLTIKDIEKQYSKKGFQFIAIIPGKDFSKNEVIEFKNKYNLKALSFLFDPNLALANYTKASITPEVVVYNSIGQKIYNGRIDNWAYELSKKRTVITENDLRNILQKMDQNQYVKPYQTKAVGCFIN
jgi:thiol-disulfide isomerase/thioredoxin